MSTYLPAALSIVALWPAAAIAAWLIAEFAPAGNAPASPPRTVRQVMLTAAAAGLATLPCDLTLQQRLWLLPAATLLIALALIDWRHQRLPDRLTQPLLWAGLLCNLNQEWVPLSDALLGAVAGYLSLWLLDALYRRARRRAGIGQGDFKLLAALGAWVGWGALPLLVSVAAAAGLCVTLARSPPGKMAWRTPLPFGVYLAAAGWLTLLLNAGAHYA
ncbi:prepilin peptidase [Serratia ficaria]|uniref:prepilin peptidase n=1 Tax=Serratia ficaria TaxID=61651 RepID=UPI0021776AE6|nr:A24 family peptidase [Serratia ficaria]CAI0761079.1 Pectic enzymes secretion protein outO [Serratia ficaria]CAI1627387.1 Pectic enzymes secretion protein outO [Serratia ficaria]CAI1627858.1 Pectic enzymes secretion protein outO [Serratia ficaria]